MVQIATKNHAHETRFARLAHSHWISDLATRLSPSMCEEYEHSTIVAMAKANQHYRSVSKL